MLILLIILVTLYSISIFRSIFRWWETKVTQFWLSIVVQSAIAIRGITLWRVPALNGSFIEQGMPSQFLVLVAGALGLVGVQWAEQAILKNEATLKALKATQARFKLIINQSPLAIQLINKNGLLVDANEAWEALWQVDKTKYQYTYNLFRDKQLIQNEFLSHIELAQSGKTVFVPHFIYTLDHPEKNIQITRWLRAHFYPLEPEDIENYVLITEDITDRIIAEEAIRESEDRWYQLVENYPEAVLISVNYHFVYCNPATVAIFGAQSKEDILGKPLFDFNNEGKSKVLMERLARLERGEPTAPYEHKMVGLDGAQRELISFSIPVTYQGEKAIQTVIRDVTTQNLNQRKLYHHEKLAAVGQLAAGIAHDFNNALSVISLNAELLLRNKKLDHKTHKRITLIHEQTQRAASLTNQILDYSRQSVIQLEPICLKDFFATFVELLKSILPQNIAIDWVDPPEAVIVIEADKSRLQQLFMNLAINSRDAMPQGGTITISLETAVSHQHAPPDQSWDNGSVTIIFKDTGGGIPDEIINHIFEPFYTTKQPDKGTGLGLAQVYGIVSQHHGLIHIDSQPNVGTSVCTTFPLSSNNRWEAEEPASAQDNFSLGHQELILVVEDHDESRAVISETLTVLNYQAILTRDGEEALQLLKNSPDPIILIISDIVMPRLNGIQLAQELADMAIPTPIILITGHPLSSQMDELGATNIVTILQKPLDVMALSSAITSAIQPV